MQTDQIPQDLLNADEFHERSTTGKRLANYLIDLFIFYLLVMVIGVVILLISPTAAELFTNESAGFGLLDRMITIVLYALYMSIIETMFKGKSIGKFITKTRAVNIDGSQISMSTAFARGFSRAVPFCAFSAFGSPSNPWQDRWTNTMVIDEKK